MRIPRHPIRALRHRLTDPKYLFCRYLPDEAVVVEAGADRGEIFRSHVEVLAAAFHAFEPRPDAYEDLVQNTADCPNVSVYPLALGAAEATAEMWVGGMSSSLLAPTLHLDAYPEVAFTEKVTVETTTLAAWARHHGIERIDGMWLDMQGYELAALKAAGGLIDTTRAIVLEVLRVELYEGCPLWPESKVG